MSLAGVLVGFTGFGFNIIAVPRLTLWGDAAEAVVLALLVGTALSVAAAVAGRADVHRQVLRMVLLGACV